MVIAYDTGTTGVKTCLFEISDQLRLIDSSYAGYGLYVLEDGGVEQEPDEWWSALCATTRTLLKKTGILPGSISAISFCSQMQGLVLVDREGRPVRRAMSYLDSRARRQFSNGLAYGLKMNGLNACKLATSLSVTRAVPASVKDPIWKYKWVQENEPENFQTRMQVAGCQGISDPANDRQQHHDARLGVRYIPI